MSGFIHSTDQSEINQPNLEVFKTEHVMRAFVWLVKSFNCLAYAWIVKDKWKLTWRDPKGHVVRYGLCDSEFAFKRYNTHLNLIRRVLKYFERIDNFDYKQGRIMTFWGPYRLMKLRSPPPPQMNHPLTRPPPSWIFFTRDIHCT